MKQPLVALASADIADCVFHIVKPVDFTKPFDLEDIPTLAIHVTDVKTGKFKPLFIKTDAVQGPNRDSSNLEYISKKIFPDLFLRLLDSDPVKEAYGEIIWDEQRLRAGGPLGFLSPNFHRYQRSIGCFEPNKYHVHMQLTEITYFDAAHDKTQLRNYREGAISGRINLFDTAEPYYFVLAHGYFPLANHFNRETFQLLAKEIGDKVFETFPFLPMTAEGIAASLVLDEVQTPRHAPWDYVAEEVDPMTLRLVPAYLPEGNQ